MSAIKVSALDQLLLDLFTTALEGGINYWSVCHTYHWSNEDGSEDHQGFYADVSDSDEYAEYLQAVKAQEDALARRQTETFEEAFDRISGKTRAPAVPVLKTYRINRTTMAQGYRLATTLWRDRISWSSGEKPPLVVGPETDWDYDAGDADMIVQLGLFGAVVYG